MKDAGSVQRIMSKWVPCEKPFKIMGKTFKIGFGTSFEGAGNGNVRDSCLGICAWLML